MKEQRAFSTKCQDIFSIPLCVSCGLFGISEDFLEKHQSIDMALIKNKEATFFFKATGSSMRPTVLAGEVLVVDRSIRHRHGKVCVLDYEGERICKRVFIYRDHVILVSDNKAFKTIKVHDPHAVIFFGVVVAKFSRVG